MKIKSRGNPESLRSFANALAKDNENYPLYTALRDAAMDIDALTTEHRAAFAAGYEMALDDWQPGTYPSPKRLEKAIAAGWDERVSADSQEGEK